MLQQFHQIIYEQIKVMNEYKAQINEYLCRAPGTYRWLLKANAGEFDPHWAFH